MKLTARLTARVPLRWWLLASHLGLAIGLGVIALLVAGYLLRASVQKNAEAQVAQAAVEALQRLDDHRRDLGVVARLLSERPTLHRLLKQRNVLAASEFLDTYRESARLDAIRVTHRGEHLLEVGSAPTAADQHGLRFESGSGATWRVERREVLDLPEYELWLVQRLPPRALLGRRSEGLELALVAADRLRGAIDPDEVLLAAQRHVLSSGQGELLRHQGGMAALRLEPLRGNDGAAIGLLAIGLPQAVVKREAAEWILAMAIGTLALIVLAGLLALRLSRRVAIPFAALASTSHRLGMGDLDAPIEPLPNPVAEADALARSLESMRQRLQELGERERAQRRELDAVLDGTDEGIVALDDARRIQYANRGFLAMFPGTEVLGRFCGDVLQPEASAGRRPCEHACPLLQARREGQAQATERCMGGGQRNLVIRSSGGEGRQVAIVREQAPQEAAQSMRDAILANLSHEFQTPLAAQLAAIELLREHLLRSGDGNGRKLVDAQYRGALRLSQLVENLLDSVRLDSGEMRLRRERVDLIEVVGDAIELMRPLFDQRDQQLLLDLPSSERVLMGDPQRLQQVVVNLLANANKFAPDQGRIWLDLVWGEQYVSLWIEDEGPGLPPLASRADLFAPFRRAPDQEPGERGSGLGLAIVRALVERHGGEVVIGAPRHRRGARFGIVLPLEAPAS